MLIQPLSAFSFPPQTPLSEIQVATNLSLCPGFVHACDISRARRGGGGATAQCCPDKTVVKVLSSWQECMTGLDLHFRVGQEDVSSPRARCRSYPHTQICLLLYICLLFSIVDVTREKSWFHQLLQRGLKSFSKVSPNSVTLDVVSVS